MEETPVLAAVPLKLPECYTDPKPRARQFYIDSQRPDPPQAYSQLRPRRFDLRLPPYYRCNRPFWERRSRPMDTFEHSEKDESIHYAYQYLEMYFGSVEEVDD